MEISELNRTCLVNMPILVDTITTTVNGLNRMLSPYYEEFRTLLKDAFANNKKYKCSLSDKDLGDHIVYPFTWSSNYKALRERNSGVLDANLQLVYLIPFQVQERKNKELFELRIIYTSNNEWNGIWFKLWEITAKRILTTSFKEDIKLRLSNDWDIYMEEGSIEIGFGIEEDISPQKIEQCAKAFKKEILLPFIASLTL